MIGKEVVFAGRFPVDEDPCDSGDIVFVLEVGVVGSPVLDLMLFELLNVAGKLWLD